MCVICLETIQEEEGLNKTLECGHMFHADCIDMWLEQKKECPVCRVSIDDDEHSIAEHVTRSVTVTRPSALRLGITSALAITALLNIMLCIALNSNIYLALWCFTGLYTIKYFLLFSKLTGIFLVLFECIDFYNAHAIELIRIVQLTGLFIQLVLTCAA